MRILSSFSVITCFSFSVILSGLNKFKICLQKKTRGAIAVEFSLCMFLAALIMSGIFLLFKNMSIQIINQFENYVLSFPNI